MGESEEKELDFVKPKVTPNASKKSTLHNDGNSGSSISRKRKEVFSEGTTPSKAFKALELSTPRNSGTAIMREKEKPLDYLDVDYKASGKSVDVDYKLLKFHLI